MNSKKSIDSRSFLLPLITGRVILSALDMALIRSHPSTDLSDALSFHVLIFANMAIIYWPMPQPSPVEAWLPCMAQKVIKKSNRLWIWSFFIVAVALTVSSRFDLYVIPVWAAVVFRTYIWWMNDRTVCAAKSPNFVDLET